MSPDKNSVESPALRLARYLKEFVGLRSTTVLDVAKYESVIWFGDMPQDADCRSGAWTDDHDPDGPWLEVRKQEFKSPPAPPDAIAPWVDAKAIRKATPDMPPLLTSIFVEDTGITLDEGATPPLVERRLSDCPDVVQVYQAFRPRWEAWSADHRRRDAVQNVYAELFRLHTQLQKQGELLELVLGLGLIDWQAKVGDRLSVIRRHAVTAQIELTFDPRNGIIRVGASGEGAKLRVEDDMLEPELRPDRSHYAAVDAQLEELADAIWDRSLMHAALRTWAGVLSPDTTWFEGLGAKRSSGNTPVMSFAPALILRSRLQTGMVRIYERMIERLGAADGDVPDGWRQLTDDEWSGGGGARTDPPTPVQDQDRSSPPPTEVYFPLPANREQRRIVDALDRNQGVLVQGPPGTGKSHTIANLMCHLLATGKRVLVTAETGRALQVLKAKLPKELQPLCVSLLGQGGDAFAELNTAVQGITNKQSSYSHGVYNDRIAEIDRELDQARRGLSQIESELRGLRQDETRPHSVLDGAYYGTASKIAARVASEREQFCWLQLSENAATHPSICSAEATRWLETLRRYSKEDTQDSTCQIADSALLAIPKEFAALVSAEATARANREQVDAVRLRSAFPALRAWSDAARCTLRENLRSIEEQRLSLQRRQAEWLSVALRDVVVGRDARWRTLLDLSKKHLERIEPLLFRVDNSIVTRPEGLHPRKLRADAGAAVEHLAAGGAWKRLLLFTPKALQGRMYLRKDILVDGQLADDAEKLTVVCDVLDLEFAMADLAAAWTGVVLVDVPVDRRLCIATLRGHASDLECVLNYAASCDQAALHMSRGAPPVPAPDWLNGEAQLWIEVIRAAGIDDELGEAERRVEACGQVLARLRQLHDVHPVVVGLLDAIASRDVTAYSTGYARVQLIERTRVAQSQRVRFESSIRTAAPGLLRNALLRERSRVVVACSPCPPNVMPAASITARSKRCGGWAPSVCCPGNGSAM